MTDPQPSDIITPCRHPQAERVRGGYGGWTIPRTPLAYGSAEVDICGVCGAWHMPIHRPDNWRPGPYRKSYRRDIEENDR